MNVSDEQANERAILLDALRTLSFRRGEVKLASGKISDFFIDCKQTVLTAAGHYGVGTLMLAALKELPDCDAVAGVALGGCPLASAVSMMSHLAGTTRQALYVRKEAKDHGTRRLIEGQLKEGTRVVILEDVITTGGSTLRAAKTLRAAGAEVVGVVVLVDRCEGGLEALQDAGLQVVTLFSRHDFIPKS